MIDYTLLKNDFEDILRDSHIQGKQRTPAQLHDALSRAIMKQAVPMMSCSAPSGRSASYLSMEFLVGRAVYNNILCLGLHDYAEELLNSAAVSATSKRSRTRLSETAAWEDLRRAFSTARRP